MKLALWVIFMLTVTIAAAWMMFRQRELRARFVAIVLVSIVPFGLTSCDGGWYPPTRPSSEMTRTQVITELEDDSRTKFCVIGVTDEKMQFQLSKTDPAAADLYEEGKFWVMIPTHDGVSSEFYNTAGEALKALTDRGVVEFRTCPKRMGL